MAWDVGALHTPGGETTLGIPRARVLDTGAVPPITAALQTAIEPPTDALLAQNTIHNLTVGDRRPRTNPRGRPLQPAIGTSAYASADNALHTCTYHSGSGGWHTTERNVLPKACPPSHFAKFRLASINPKFRRCSEVCRREPVATPPLRAPQITISLTCRCVCVSAVRRQVLWSLYQAKVKRAMHRGGVRSVNAETAAHATQGQLAEQRALLAAQPALANELATAETFTGAVPQTLKGSKRYWRLAFVQVMAMTLEYGVPEFFATFTANEMGWVDLRRACEGASFGSRPVEATRHYHHRWEAFKSKFLRGETPLGKIAHIWYRHEEQARGSLHVHAAIWIERVRRPDGSWASGAKPDAIVGVLPRVAADAPAHHRKWRKFVHALQLHVCQEGCRYKNKKRVNEPRADGHPFCKGGYPRRRWTSEELAERSSSGAAIRCKLDAASDRYEYRTEAEEDLRVSPYVPLWLLAWGANMNIQFMTATSFLSYISKYVPKPEPSTRVEDTVELRNRDNRNERQVRYLNARRVGAPEVVFDLFEYKMKEGAQIIHLTTQTPAQRRRCLHRRQPAMPVIGESDGEDDEAAEDEAYGEGAFRALAPLRFYDGLIEKYEKRPRGVYALADGTLVDFDAMTYPSFWRWYDVVPWSAVALTTIQRAEWWRPLLTPSAQQTARAPSRRDPIVVRRLSAHPVWWDWKVPSRHGQSYYYQKLLLNVPFRSAESRDFVTQRNENVTNFNVSGTMREECVLRGLVDADDELGGIERDAHERHMTAEAITRTLAQEGEWLDGGDAVLDAMQHDGPVELDEAAGGNTIDAEDARRFADAVNNANDTRPPPPNVVGRLWIETLDDGGTRALELSVEQLDAYERLKCAGTKQLLTFLSGQGGTGKSTLIRLLTQWWRSQGLRVLLTASSGKAARLIDGHTVHAAFKLHSTGFFVRQGLEGAQGTRHFNFLATVDVVIIDEISMLPADCLNGVNSALNYVMTRATTQRGLMSFGRKSVLAIGDVRDARAHSCTILLSLCVCRASASPALRPVAYAVRRSCTSCRPSSAHSSTTRSTSPSCGASFAFCSSPRSCEWTQRKWSSPSCSATHARDGKR